MKKFFLIWIAMSAWLTVQSQPQRPAPSGTPAHPPLIPAAPNGNVPLVRPLTGPAAILTTNNAGSPTPNQISTTNQTSGMTNDLGQMNPRNQAGRPVNFAITNTLFAMTPAQANAVIQ